VPSYLKYTAGGKSISGGTLAPRTNRYTTGQIATNLLGVLKLDTPVLATASAGNASFTVVINNYDASAGYTISTSAGSISRTTSTLTVTGLAANASATVTVTATKAGFTNSDPATRTGNAAATCSCVYQYTQVEGGNCCCTGMCGAPNQVCCYDIYVYAPASTPCTGGSGSGSCNAGIGGWYACDGTC